MPIPLMAIGAALAAGGHLVAHSAGGLIVTSAASSYVAGTYISTAALGSFLTATAGVAVVGTAAAVGGIAYAGWSGLVGLAASMIGGAGWFGTTFGATGITAMLMSVGIVPAVPVAVPVAIGASAVMVLAGIGWWFRRRIASLRDKVFSTPEGQEARFTDREARLVEKLLKKALSPRRWWQKLFFRSA